MLTGRWLHDSVSSFERGFSRRQAPIGIQSGTATNDKSLLIGLLMTREKAHKIVQPTARSAVRRACGAVGQVRSPRVAVDWQASRFREAEIIAWRRRIALRPQQLRERLSEGCGLDRVAPTNVSQRGIAATKTCRALFTSVFW